MTLPLVTPIGSNFVKDWPSQNAINCDLFDAAAGACLTTHALGTYTPVWSASTTNPVIGTGGVQLGYYYLVFNMVYVYVELRFGSAGANRGSGSYVVSLPFKAASIINDTGGKTGAIGNGQVYSNSIPASRQSVMVLLQGPAGYAERNHVQLGTRMGGTTHRLVTESLPFVFNSLDGLMFCARYQRDMT